MKTEEMRRLRDKGLSYQAIANKAGLSKQRIHQLLNYDNATLNAKKREYRQARRLAKA